MPLENNNDLLAILGYLFTIVSPVAITLLTLILDRRIRSAKAKQIEVEANKTESEAIEVTANTTKVLTGAATDIVTMQQNAYGKQIAQIRLDQIEDRKKHTKEMKELNIMIADFRKQNIEVKTENASLRQVIRKWKTGITKLIKQLEKADIIPIWTPEDISDIT